MKIEKADPKRILEAIRKYHEKIASDFGCDSCKQYVPYAECLIGPVTQADRPYDCLMKKPKGEKDETGPLDQDQ